MGLLRLNRPVESALCLIGGQFPAFPLLLGVVRKNGGGENLHHRWPFPLLFLVLLFPVYEHQRLEFAPLSNRKKSSTSPPRHNCLCMQMFLVFLTPTRDSSPRRFSDREEGTETKSVPRSEESSCALEQNWNMRHPCGTDFPILS